MVSLVGYLGLVQVSARDGGQLERGETVTRGEFVIVTSIVEVRNREEVSHSINNLTKTPARADPDTRAGCRCSLWRCHLGECFRIES